MKYKISINKKLFFLKTIYACEIVFLKKTEFQKYHIFSKYVVKYYFIYIYIYIYIYILFIYKLYYYLSKKILLEIRKKIKDEIQDIY